MRFRYSGWLAYHRSRTPTSGLSKSAIAKPLRMRSHRSSAGRAKSIECAGSGSLVSGGVTTGGTGTTGVGLAAGGSATGAGAGAAADAATAAGAGAETAGAAAGDVSSFRAESGLEFQGICEHAAADTHIAAAARSLLKFSVNGSAFFICKSRDSTHGSRVGQASWRFRRTFSACRPNNAPGRKRCQLIQNWFFHCRNAANTPAGSLTRLPRYLFADSMTAGRITRRNGLVAFSRAIVAGTDGRLSPRERASAVPRAD